MSTFLIILLYFWALSLTLAGIYIWSMYDNTRIFLVKNQDDMIKVIETLEEDIIELQKICFGKPFRKRIDDNPPPGEKE